MAGVEEKDVEYESDPEEAKLSLKSRRREASDDEDEDESEKTEKPSRRIVSSDDESEGQGAADEYFEDDDEEEEEVYVEEEVNEETVVKAEEDAVNFDEVTDGAFPYEDNEVLRELESGMEDGSGPKEEEEKLYAVPTAGAFYMHDDRFRDNARGRGRGRQNRRSFGERKLWESKDDWKWGHDKFEEQTMEERRYEEGRRTSRGRYRGRGRAQGVERGASRGRRPRAPSNDYDQSTNNNQKIQNNAPRSIRGRGPSRYRPLSKENIDAPPLNKQSGQSGDKRSHNSTGKASAPVSHLETYGSTSVKQGFVSSLNYASPPFYPSSSSTKEIRVTHKRESPTGTRSNPLQAPQSGGSFAAAQSTTVLQGKDMSDSMGIDKLKIVDSVSAFSRKLPSSLQMPRGSSSVNSDQSQSLRGQGRTPPMNLQYPVSNNQGSRVSQSNSTQRNSVQNRVQSSSQAMQHYAQQSSSGFQSSSSHKTGRTVNTLHEELESSSELGKSKSGVVAKGKGDLQGPGRGLVLGGGAQVMGVPGMGGGHGDSSSAYLPVMQFGGQQPGGMRVPAVGMAFPGYVGQPQLGLGNSNMTWLPVLAGAAGALGATYGSPYFSMDGAYHARPSGGQMSSLTASPSKEDTPSKSNPERRPQQENELANDNSGQRQKNPRRYTEMKFDNERVP